MEPDEQRKYWNNLAFYNYIQPFTKMNLTHTSLYGVEEELSNVRSRFATHTVWQAQPYVF